MGEHLPALTDIVTLIASSPITVTQPAARLPAGFDEVDADILVWIAAEGRRLGHAFPLM